MRSHLITGCLLFVLLSFGASAAAATVTVESLLRDMVDRDLLARRPEPAFICQQVSSYDRASVAPDRPGWFANEDFSNFLRVEEHDGRKEYVMMDADGPGAIVCFFKATTDPAAVVRIYLDGSATPTVEENLRYFLGGSVETEQEHGFDEKRVPGYQADESRFLGGFGTIPYPLAGVQSLGCNLYLPMPYSRHCKVTYDRPGKCYYRIDYRTYPAGTSVQTFTLPGLKQAAPVLHEVARTLLEPKPGGVTKQLPPQMAALPPGSVLTAEPGAGEGALRRLRIRLKAENMAQALRSTVLIIACDGERTVWCPVGDFFGAGIGVHAHKGWDDAVESDGTMQSDWVMPFRETCKVELRNLGPQPIEAAFAEVAVGPWKWDARSMRFHATWRQQDPIRTKRADGTMDWNYVQISGEGVYVGDSLVVHNSSARWWGEGDEKIYVDGETFPSHFGTGTEDYYGYSRGGPASAYFESPFLAHVQIEGDKSPNYSAMTRVRSLDAIPFSNRLKMDMEIWHWEAAVMSYAAVTYWYAVPGATSNRNPDDTEAARPVLPTSAAQSPQDR